MPFDPSDPQQTQQFYDSAIKAGGTPEQVKAYIAQRQASVAPQAPVTQPTPSAQPLPDQPPSLSETYQKGGIGAVVAAIPGNAVRSGVNTVKDIGSALVNTVNPDMQKNTIANLGRLAVGTGQLLIPGEQGLENVPRAVGDFYKNRYGSLGAVANTAFNDPVGALLDASMVLDAGGSAVGKIGELSKIEKLAQAGKVAKDVGEVINPLNIAGKAILPTAEKVAGKAGEVVGKIGDGVIVDALKANTSQKVNFKSLIGEDLANFVKKNKLYGSPDAAVASAQKLIDPLQETYNGMVRTGKTISGEDLATALRDRAAEIAAKDRSPVARATADALNKEADIQAKLGDVTDTVLTNTKTSEFSKAPLSAMTDPVGFNVQKELGGVGIQLLDKYAPGSAAIGKKLQGLREFQGLALTNAEKSSGLMGAVKTGIGAQVGNAVGTAMGNPIAGTLAGGAISYGMQNPAIASAVGRGIDAVGSGLGKIPSLAGKALQIGSVPSRLVPSTGESQLQGDSNNNANNNNFNQGLPSNPSDVVLNSAPSINGSSSGTIASTPTNSQVGDNQMLSTETNNPYGASPQQIYEAYIKTAGQGNKKKAAILYQMFKDEVAFQQLKHPKLNSAGAKALSDNQTAIDLTSQLADTLKNYSSIMGPVQGQQAKFNPWNTDVQTFQAQMNAAAQVIGRSMEGGVLRQEDEVKYRKILPQVTDTPAVAQNKLKNIVKLLKDQQKNQMEFYKNVAPDSGLGATPSDSGVGV